MDPTDRVTLGKVRAALVKRVVGLQARVDGGDEAAWPDLCEAARTLATIAGATAPEATGSLLTTGQLAERLGVKPKTILRYRREGKIQPAVANGKGLRWDPRARP